MTKLEEIIEKIAKKLFDADSRDDRMQVKQDFFTKHCTLRDLYNQVTSDKVTVDESLKGYLSGNGTASKITTTVLWPRLKDSYIEKAVKQLENKIEDDLHITLEFKRRYREDNQS
jgi:hypothetical protein